eukprot:830258-Ditylum_brightwellii.AAC.1
MTFNGAILMWHMGSQDKKVPVLKLLQTYHFSHLKHRVERVAMVKGTWMNDGWDEAASRAKRKQKRFEQLSWEIMY